MRDFEKEEAANNQAVAKIEGKLRMQEAIVASLAIYDPRRHQALIVLHEMRQNSVAVEFLRSLSRYDEKGH